MVIFRLVSELLWFSPFKTKLLEIILFFRQDLRGDLESQEEQAEAVLKEVGLVSSVASPQVMEALSVDCSRLREAISHTKDLIHLKREERDKGLLKVIKGQDPCLFQVVLERTGESL